ncbi:hypothetical protein [Natrarchaeobius chitinivorans]|uniref:DUF8054 domain-containing protein n=1 Tax=Natrarchaeobius chitinivorans TaxID=1679083 RepID=A0A3N6MBB1_NATCH|nr:hypothetical protein [Natrarchaeobius chitinivorans]RQG97964.1 hypothetical protein EA473_01870 [Natrarchaeobius chitinivorans]
MYAMASTVLESLRGWRTAGTDAELPRERTGTDMPDSGESAAETLLRSTSAVVDVDRGNGEDGLSLESTFHSAWDDRMREIRESGNRLEELADRLDRGTDRLALEVTDDGFAATCDREQVGCWPSDGAFLADLAATAVLCETDPTWQTLEQRERRLVLTALRLFLERCPTCDGSLAGGRNGDESDGSTECQLSVQCLRCGSLLVREPVVDC